MEAKNLKLNLLKDKIKRNSNIRAQDRYSKIENEMGIIEEQI